MILRKKSSCAISLKLGSLSFQIINHVQSGRGEGRGIQALKEEGFEDSGICASTLKQQSAKTIDCNGKPDSQACECRTNGHHYPGHYHYRQGYSDRIALMV